MKKRVGEGETVVERVSSATRNVRIEVPKNIRRVGDAYRNYEHNTRRKSQNVLTCFEVMVA